MNIKLWGSLIALVAGAVVAKAGPVDEYVPGEVLVKFKNSSASLAAIKANKRINAEVVDELTEIGVSLVRIPDSVSVEQAVKYYSSLPNVEFAEPNGIVHAFFTPNDTSYASQQWGPQKINCPGAWDLNQGSSSVIIAIVDTGINYNHPDLSGKTVPGYDYVNNDSDPMDDNGHGTHCAGISAAKTNNTTGIAGVGFNCSLMPVKVLNSGGSGSFSAIASGVNFATSHGAKVVSMSLGGSSGSATMQSAVDNAWNNGVLVVAAAGNSNSTAASYPAFYTNCIAVASTTSTDARSSFSNYGSWVDVAAPGSNIYATYGSSYSTLSGTSMACPHVAGLGGLLWSQLGTSTPVATIRQRIEQNCDNVGTFVVYGRVNAFKALNAGSGGGPAVTLSSVSIAPSSVVGGNAAVGTVTLNNPAPAGGLPVTLSSNNGAAQVNNLTVPEGSTTANFPVTTSAVVSTQNCTITGVGGGQTRTASLLVTPPPSGIYRDFGLSTYSVQGGSGLYGYLYLNASAPAGGATFTISQSGGGFSVLVPHFVTIPAGQSFARFNIATGPVGATVVSTISATYLGVTKTKQLTVTP